MAVAELTKPKSGAADGLARKPRSLLSDSMRRLRRNKVAVASIIVLVLVVLAAIFAPLITTGDFAKQDLLLNNAVPPWMVFLLPSGAENYANITTEALPVGRDDLGRDLWTRVVYGARVSLMVAFVAATVSLIVGLVYRAYLRLHGGSN